MRLGKNSNNEIKGIILSATSERGQGHGILVEPRTKLLMEAREVLRVAGRATRNERSWNKKDVDGGTGLEYRKKEKKKGRKDSRESRTLRQIREMSSIGFSYQIPRRGRYTRPIAIFDIPSGRDKVFIFHETRRKNSESTVIVGISYEWAQFT